jgi:hypothetical protein
MRLHLSESAVFFVSVLSDNGAQILGPLSIDEKRYAENLRGYPYPRQFA